MDKRRSGAGAIVIVSILLLMPIVPILDSVKPSRSDEDPVQDVWFSGGQLEWGTMIWEIEGQALSTPALEDLNNDGDLETIVFSSNGSLMALGPDGEYFWQDPYQVDEMEVLGENDWTDHATSDPPPFFSSPLVADINLGDKPEIIIGAGDGLYSIGANGEKQWKYEIPNGSVFCSPTLVDLEGTIDLYSPDKNDYEIIFISDFENGTSNLTILDVVGDLILDQMIFDHHPGTASSVVAEDLDGSFWNNLTKRTPDETEETDMELVVSSYGGGMNLFELNDPFAGPSAGYFRAGRLLDGSYNPATPIVANVNLDPNLEVVYSTANYNGNNWQAWRGRMRVVDSGYKEIGGISFGDARSAIIGSPVMGDLQGTAYENWNGNDMEIIYGTVGGLLCVKNSGFGDPYMVFDTGGPIISSPALCDYNDDDELEIVIASDSGKIFMLDGDPSDGIDEGVPYPGDGPTQDVIWCYDTGVEIGISSPVVADIDLDGMLEVVVGSTEGQVYCISAGGWITKGKSVWPTFHGNNQRTGLYSDYPSFDVDVYPKKNDLGIPDPTVKGIRPGSFNTLNFSIELEGYGIPEIDKEKVYVRIDETTIPSGWAAWLDTPEHRGNDNPDYVMLASEETVHCMLKVWAPWVGDDGDMARIVVDAFCESDPYRNDRIEFMAVLKLYYYFELFFLKSIDQDPLSELRNEKWDKVQPGSSGFYTISINNKGNVNDTYDLSLSTPPREAGWDWYFVETGTMNANVSLTAQFLADVFGGISGQTFTVAVTAPINATKDTRVPILLKGRSQNFTCSCKNSERRDELHLIVGEIHGLSLSTNRSYIISSDINGTFVVYITMENTGNKDVINVLLSVEGKISGLDVKFPEEPIQVYKDQSKIIPIRIRMPIFSIFELRPGSLINFTFVGMCEGVPSSESSVKFTIEVGQYKHLSYDLELPDNMEFMPGGNFTGALEVYSLSNFDDEIYLSLDHQVESVDIELYDNKWELVSGFPLKMDESFLVNFIVNISEHALAGKYPITIILNPNVNDPIEIIFYVNVSFKGDLKMELSYGRIHAKDDISINEMKIYKLKVTNNGNDDDLAALSLGRLFNEDSLVKAPMNQGWKASFYGVTMTDQIHGKEVRISYPELRKIDHLEEDTYYRLTSIEEYPYNYHEIEFLIGQGETWYVDIVVWPESKDGRSMVDDTTLQVIGRSVDPSVLEKVHLELRINYPDLMFGETIQFFNSKDVPVEEPLSKGDHTLLFNVYNVGNSSSPATYIISTIDAETMIRSELAPMEPGSRREITIKVTLTEGPHTIRIELDPQNDVIELNDQVVDEGTHNNNQRIILVEIDDDTDTLPIAALAIGLTISVLVMAAILFVLLFVWRRPGSASDEE